MNAKSRNLNLDLIRCVAVFFVLSVHFFYNNEFYGVPVMGFRMYIMVVMRTLFVVCVPLFLLLTGYLCNRKMPSRKYYKGIRHTLEVYLLIGILCIIFRRFVFLEELSLGQCIIAILDFSACRYGWYVEMYIGLFLLIPFLNVLYHGLDTQKKKLALVLTCLLLTTVPSLTNIYDLHTPSFWLDPSLATSYAQILPDWWTLFYPITYYFIGAYLCEFDWKISRQRNLMLLMGCVLLFSGFNIYRCAGQKFIWAESFVDWGGFENVIDSVLCFVLLSHLNLSRCKKPVRVVITKISELSLGIYLASAITDQFLYPWLNSTVPHMILRLNYYPLVVPATFLMALIISQLTQWLLLPLNRGLDSLISRYKRSRTEVSV